MLSELAKIATKLDSMGMSNDADLLDKLISKLAQVATTGVPGATYSGGVQVGTGTPGGVSKKFYRSKPKTLSEFNGLLGELVLDISKNVGQNVFTQDVISNPPTSQMSRWTEQTSKAFKQYADAAGYPEAGLDWKSFAKTNGYEPTLYGIYSFWERTISNVLNTGFAGYMGEKEEGTLPSAGETQSASGSYTADNQSRIKPPETQLASVESDFRSNLPGIRQRLNRYFTPGTHLELGRGGISTHTEDIMRMISEVKDYNAKRWFAQDPFFTIPASISGPKTGSEMLDIFEGLIGEGTSFPTLLPSEVNAIYKYMALINKSVHESSQEKPANRFGYDPG